MLEPNFFSATQTAENFIAIKVGVRVPLDPY